MYATAMNAQEQHAVSDQNEARLRARAALPKISSSILLQATGPAQTPCQPSAPSISGADQGQHWQSVLGAVCMSAHDDVICCYSHLLVTDHVIAVVAHSGSNRTAYLVDARPFPCHLFSISCERSRRLLRSRGARCHALLECMADEVVAATAQQQPPPQWCRFQCSHERDAAHEAQAPGAGA
jgi:hypothetical protein